METRALVLGGGIAGLTIALRWKSKHPEWEVCVAEARPRFGGRIHSILDSDSQAFVQDSGAWRVHHTHRRMRALATELGIKLVKTHAQPEHATSALAASRARVPDLSAATVPGFTIKQSLAFRLRPEQIDEVERSTGFVSSLDGGRRTYSVGSRKDSGMFFTTDCGISAFIDRLVQECRRAGVVLSLNTRAVSIKKKQNKYEVILVRRDGDEFTRETQTADYVASTLTPDCLRKVRVNFRTHIAPALASVESMSLVRVYVDLKSPHKLARPIMHVTGDVLGQIISVSPTKLMLVYAAGWMTGWHQKSFMMDRQIYTKNLQKLYAEQRSSNPDLNLPQTTELDWEHVCQCFWQHAVHRWRPEAFTSDRRPPVDLCVHPHIQLPNFFMLNEAFSSEQGWAEGALECVEIALNPRRPVYARPRVRQPYHIVFDKRLIDVRVWMDQHPGGRQAIENHLKDEDSTALILHVHNHSSQVMAYMMGMQDGFST